MNIKEALGGPILSIAVVAILMSGKIHVRHFTEITRMNEPVQFWIVTTMMAVGAAWFFIKDISIKVTSKYHLSHYLPVPNHAHRF